MYSNRDLIILYYLLFESLLLFLSALIPTIFPGWQYIFSFLGKPKIIVFNFKCFDLYRVWWNARLFSIMLLLNFNNLKYIIFSLH